MQSNKWRGNVDSSSTFLLRFLSVSRNRKQKQEQKKEEKQTKIETEKRRRERGGDELQALELWIWCLHNSLPMSWIWSFRCQRIIYIICRSMWGSPICTSMNRPNWPDPPWPRNCLWVFLIRCGPITWTVWIVKKMWDHVPWAGGSIHCQLLDYHIIYSYLVCAMWIDQFQQVGYTKKKKQFQQAGLHL